MFLLDAASFVDMILLDFLSMNYSGISVIKQCTPPAKFSKES